MELAREELAAALVNRQATIFTVDGRATKARVLAVNSMGLSLDAERTPSIPYGAVTHIQLTEYVGRGRAIGTAVGGGLGLLAGLTAAGVLGIGSATVAEKTGVALLGIGAMPTGALIGRFIGKWFDRQVVIIRIAP